MKNYAGFYVILATLCAILAYNSLVVVKTDSLLVERAHELKAVCDSSYADRKAAYDVLEKSFFDTETLITSFINHSAYSEAKNNIIEIRYDIEYGDICKLKSDVDELISYLEDIADNEKLKINNIF